MRSLQERIQEYKNKHQGKPKEKIQLQNIEEMKLKLYPKIEDNKLQQQNKYLKKFSIESYLSDIKLPPKNVPWIGHILKYKTITKQYEILKRYKALYWQAYRQASLEHQKSNAGTLKANTWLRVLVIGE